MKTDLGFQVLSCPSVFIFDLLGQTEPFVPDSPDSEDTERDGGDEDGQAENEDQFFLSFDGEP